MFYHITKKGHILYSGNAERIREKLEVMIEEELDFFVMLQELDESEGDNLEIYVHTETYEYIDDEQNKLLYDLGITDDPSSLTQICNLLDIEITKVFNVENIYTDFEGGN